MNNRNRWESATTGKKFEHKHTNDNNYHKVRNHCHYTGKYKAVTQSKYSIPKDISMVINESLNYDYVLS